MSRLLERLSDRLQHGLAAHGPPVIPVGGGRFDCDGRRLVAVATRPRRGAVRVDLAPGWPWPQRRAVQRAARGRVVWVHDEQTLRTAVAIVRRAVWRSRRLGAGR